MRQPKAGTPIGRETPGGTKRAVQLLVAAVLILGLGCSGDGADPKAPGEPEPAKAIQPALAPDSNCTHRVFGGGEYRFCNKDRSWADARSRCQAQGMDLVRIESAAENDFIRNNIDGDWWIGASDQVTEGTWVWAIGGSQFWSGAASGSAVGGLFSPWDSGQPNNLGNEDCAQI